MISETGGLPEAKWYVVFDHRRDPSLIGLHRATPDQLARDLGVRWGKLHESGTFLKKGGSLDNAQQIFLESKGFEPRVFRH